MYDLWKMNGVRIHIWKYLDSIVVEKCKLKYEWSFVNLDFGTYEHIYKQHFEKDARKLVFIYFCYWDICGRQLGNMCGHFDVSLLGLYAKDTITRAHKNTHID